MGYDASCILRMEGSRTRGTARLEDKALLFRGPVRLSIPLATIDTASAEDDVLRVRFGGRLAEFEIGANAAKWAARITNPPTRVDKLGIKPGMLVAAAGIADPTFVGELEARGATIVPLCRSSQVDIVFHPAAERTALEALSRLKHSIRPSGAIWVIRPKGSKAITESETMAAGKRAGLVDVKVVSFSDTLTAEKFVIPVAQRPAAGTAGRMRSHGGRVAAGPARGMRKGRPA